MLLGEIISQQRLSSTSSHSLSNPLFGDGLWTLGAENILKMYLLELDSVVSEWHNNPKDAIVAGISWW